MGELDTRLSARRGEMFLPLTVKRPGPFYAETHEKCHKKTEKDMQATDIFRGQSVNIDYQLARLHRPDSLESNIFLCSRQDTNF